MAEEIHVQFDQSHYGFQAKKMMLEVGEMFLFFDSFWACFPCVDKNAI